MKVTDQTNYSDTDAFAVFSLPHSSDHIIISGCVSRGLPYEGGFVIQKFDKGGEPCWYIHKETEVHNGGFAFETSDKCTEEATPKERYLSYAQETIDAIKSTPLQKVVMSRIATEARQGDIANGDQLYQLFIKIKETYPKAFVFLYHLPGEGCWCGATPEVLLEKLGDEWMTMALAGTQMDHGIALDEVTWGAKEAVEQQIIEQYVTDIIEKLPIRYYKCGPTTVRAGHVLHIQTTFRMKGVEDPLQLADLLHPGPAICGVPDDEALSMIKKHEDHQRQHYCGYIGPWEISGLSALYINLRSMRIYKDRYVLYLGGGLTIDSVASAEWNETELKAKIMLSVIRQSKING